MDSSMVCTPRPADSDADVPPRSAPLRHSRGSAVSAVSAVSFKTAKDGRRYATVVGNNGRISIIWGSRDSSDEQLQGSVDAKFLVSIPVTELAAGVEPAAEPGPAADVDLVWASESIDGNAVDQPSLVTHVARRNGMRWLGIGSLVATCCLLLSMGVSLIIGVRPVVLTTGSMSPVAPVGSLLIAETVEPDSVAVGDILVMTRPTGLVVTHRVIERTVTGGLVTVRTKGDANDDLDPTPYSVVGTHRRSRWVIPSAGKALLLLRTKLFRLLIVAALAAIIVHVGTTELRRLLLPRPVDGGVLAGSESQIDRSTGP